MNPTRQSLPFFRPATSNTSPHATPLNRSQWRSAPYSPRGSIQSGNRGAHLSGSRRDVQVVVTQNPRITARQQHMDNLLKQAISTANSSKSPVTLFLPIGDSSQPQELVVFPLGIQARRHVTMVNVEQVSGILKELTTVLAIDSDQTGDIIVKCKELKAQVARLEAQVSTTQNNEIDTLPKQNSELMTKAVAENGQSKTMQDLTLENNRLKEASEKGKKKITELNTLLSGQVNIHSQSVHGNAEFPNFLGTWSEHWQHNPMQAFHSQLMDKSITAWPSHLHPENIVGSQKLLEYCEFFGITPDQLINRLGAFQEEFEKLEKENAVLKNKIDSLERELATPKGHSVHTVDEDVATAASALLSLSDYPKADD